MTKSISRMSLEEFASVTNVSRETLERLELYVSLLMKWQEAINLVSTESLSDVWRRHILDSAQLVPHIPTGAEGITDLGSGAGFPGLVLSIMLDHPVHLVEAAGKKAAFLREVARQTGAPAIVHNARIEKAEAWPSQVVVARALAPLPRLLDYALPFLNKAGSGACCIFLKGSHADEELTEAAKSWTMQVDHFHSVSDPTGIILRIQDIVRD